MRAFMYGLQTVLILLIGWVIALFCDNYHPAQKYIGSGETRTYIIDNPTKLPLPMDLIRKTLSDWREIKARPPPKSVDFIFCIFRGSKELYDVSAKLRFRIQSGELTDKAKFHAHIAKTHPEIIAKSFEITAQNVGTVNISTPHMIRANWGFKGAASEVATTSTELQKLYKRFSVLPPRWNKGEPARVIASEYIVDPMLFQGYKFHVRWHIIVVLLPNRRYFALIPIGEIMPAAQKYVAGDWSNRDIHDTHFISEERAADLMELPDAQNIFDRSIETLRGLNDMLPLLSQYSGAEASYDVFGVDMMYWADGRPVIIEVNLTPGLDSPGELLKKTIRQIVNGVFCTAVSDTFGKQLGDRSGVIIL